eukprot:gene24015-29140_t
MHAENSEPAEAEKMLNPESPIPSPAPAVAVFWDIENCQVPQAADPARVASNIMELLLQWEQPGPITHFAAYGDFQLANKELRLALQAFEEVEACRKAEVDDRSSSRRYTGSFRDETCEQQERGGGDIDWLEDSASMEAAGSVNISAGAGRTRMPGASSSSQPSNEDETDDDGFDDNEEDEAYEDNDAFGDDDDDAMDDAMDDAIDGVEHTHHDAYLDDHGGASGVQEDGEMYEAGREAGAADCRDGVRFTGEYTVSEQRELMVANLRVQASAQLRSEEVYASGNPPKQVGQEAEELRWNAGGQDFGRGEVTYLQRRVRAFSRQVAKAQELNDADMLELAITKAQSNGLKTQKAEIALDQADQVALEVVLKDARK